MRLIDWFKNEELPAAAACKSMPIQVSGQPEQVRLAAGSQTAVEAPSSRPRWPRTARISQSWGGGVGSGRLDWRARPSPIRPSKQAKQEPSQPLSAELAQNARGLPRSSLQSTSPAPSQTRNCDRSVVLEAGGRGGRTATASRGCRPQNPARPIEPGAPNPANC